MEDAKKWITYDLYRYYGEDYTKIKNKIKSMFSSTIKYMILFRKIQFGKNEFMNALRKQRLRRLSCKTFIQIPTETKTGKGFYIGHLGRIIVNPRVVIGNNVNIATGVVIGQINIGEKKGCPVIGNEVWIGANSVIIGNIKIGNNVLIAPNAYVNFDVPDNSIVIGNPGTIHYKENATEGYINRRVLTELGIVKELN